MTVNVPMSEAGKKRIEAEEKTWDARKMLPLFVAFLGTALVLLYCLSNYTEWMGIAKP